MVDLNADIVPGVSAAGFRIGQTFAEIQQAELSHNIVRKWDETRDPLSFAIEETEGWLLADPGLRRPERLGKWLYFHHGTVNLDFNADGVLYSISVWKVYRGRFANAVQIGDRLEKVLALTNLFFDSGDELYYPTEDSPFRGIGFYTGCVGEVPLEEARDQVIIGISVQDWSLQ